MHRPSRRGGVIPMPVGITPYLPQDLFRLMREKRHGPSAVQEAKRLECGATNAAGKIECICHGISLVVDGEDDDAEILHWKSRCPHQRPQEHLQRPYLQHSQLRPLGKYRPQRDDTGGTVRPELCPDTIDENAMPAKPSNLQHLLNPLNAQQH